jgi:hypothetical protein
MPEQASDRRRVCFFVGHEQLGEGGRSTDRDLDGARGSGLARVAREDQPVQTVPPELADEGGEGAGDDRDDGG